MRAGGVGAAQTVPGMGRQGRRGAHAAEALPRAPDGQGARVGEQARLGRRQHRGERPELLEGGARRGRGRGIGGQVDQHAARPLVPAEQHQRRIRHGPGGGRVVQERDVRGLPGAEQLGAAARHQVARRRVGARRLDPARVLALLGAPLQVGAGEEVGPPRHQCRPHTPRMAADSSRAVRRMALPAGRGACARRRVRVQSACCALAEAPGRPAEPIYRYPRLQGTTLGL